jgi:hypothetical protein
VNPETAPLRADLPYLRRRSRPAPPPAAPHVSDFIAGRRPSPVKPKSAPPVTPPSTSLSLSPPRSTKSFRFQPRRTEDGTTTILTPRRPTVMLNRLQSGIGAIRMHMIWTAPQQGRLGCIFRMTSGDSAVAWPGSLPAARDPLALTMQADLAVVTVDLLRARQLDRMILVATLDHHLPDRPPGALLINTYGGARIEVPLDDPPIPGVLVLLSMSNLNGEFVLRAEREPIPGAVRDAAVAYGFDRITWYDGYTAIT